MTINHAELIEELQVAIDDLRALHVAKKNDMESITGFSADAIATLYETSRDRISTLTAERDRVERAHELAFRQAMENGSEASELRRQVASLTEFLEDVEDGLSWNPSTVQCLDRIQTLCRDCRATLTKGEGDKP